MASSAVAAHEQEHVTHNAQSAEKQGMTAHSTVVIHTAICPECGKAYVSGGTTTTTYTAKPPKASEDNKGNYINTTL